MAEQRRHQAFADWVDAIRLRGAMKNLGIERISQGEWEEHDRPTEPFK